MKPGFILDTGLIKLFEKLEYRTLVKDRFLRERTVRGEVIQEIFIREAMMNGNKMMKLTFIKEVVENGRVTRKPVPEREAKTIKKKEIKETRTEKTHKEGVNNKYPEKIRTVQDASLSLRDYIMEIPHIFDSIYIGRKSVGTTRVYLYKKMDYEPPLESSDYGSAAYESSAYASAAYEPSSYADYGYLPPAYEHSAYADYEDLPPTYEASAYADYGDLPPDYGPDL